jgi:hypothetical protein
MASTCRKEVSAKSSAPEISAQTSSSSNRDADSLTTESVLKDVLQRVTALSLKLRSSATVSHDPLAVERHAQQRAAADISSSLSRHLSRLETMRGPSETHRYLDWILWLIS